LTSDDIILKWDGCKTKMWKKVGSKLLITVVPSNTQTVFPNTLLPTSSQDNWRQMLNCKQPFSSLNTGWIQSVYTQTCKVWKCWNHAKTNIATAVGGVGRQSLITYHNNHKRYFQITT